MMTVISSQTETRCDGVPVVSANSVYAVAEKSRDAVSQR